MKKLIGDTVRMVMLQFSFSNIKAVPTGLFEKSAESIEELFARKSEIKGVQFLEPIQDVFVLHMLKDLAEAGYVLVDAFFRMRTNTQGRPYPVVRFIFALTESVRPDGEFADHRENAIQALSQMCESAMWRIRGFLNPFFQEGEVVEGTHAISINLEARNPLIDGSGQPIVRWKKDEDGERIGDAPVPVQPELSLRIVEDDICVVSV